MSPVRSKIDPAINHTERVIIRIELIEVCQQTYRCKGGDITYTRTVRITLVVDNRLFSISIIFHARDAFSILLDKPEGFIEDLFFISLSPDTSWTDTPFFYFRNEPVGSLYCFYEPLCASDFRVA